MSDDNLQLPSRTLAQRVFAFLGSMDLAITLLLTLAVASVIGTVLQQNQPYTDYVIKFGPFWFDIFESAGLYDVYSALWFLAILTLLVISTSVCIIRNTPSMIRDMRHLRTGIQENSLYEMRHKKQWLVSLPMEGVASDLELALVREKFRVKSTLKADGILISAMRGGLNRLGYILTHAAIVIICVGGLLDSNLSLKLAEWQGKIKIETRDLAVSQVPSESRLPIGSQAFRGSVNIPEGRSSNIVFLAMRDGYLIQDLPFKLEVKDFRIEHYATGQPKSFETDLLVHDEDLDTPLATTISVNHPLIYKGYAIYQASFSDGGTGLTIEGVPLDSRIGEQSVSFEAKVFESQKMHWAGQVSQLEITSFRLFNINPDPTEEDPNRVRNFGPSFGYKLRSSTGEAREYLNYMLPVERNGREYYLSGVRSSPAEGFAYLYLPIDAEGDLTGFQELLQQLHDPDVVDKIATEMMLETLSAIDSQSTELQQSLQETLQALVAMFVRGGFAEVSNFIDTVLPEVERGTLGPAYLSMLREMLSRIYLDDLGLASTGSATKAQLLFLQDSVDAIGSLPRYGSPVFLLLTDYDHVEASGLQIARSPGKPIVYSGCAALIVGIFILFYLPQRRLWIMVKAKNGSSDILLAGMSNRDPREFDVFFEYVSELLKKSSGNSKA